MSQTRSQLEGGSDTAQTPKGAVSVATSDTLLVPVNPNRVELTITNDSTNIVYLALGATAEANKGIRLNANGGSYTTSSYDGEVRAIALTGASVVTFVEV